MKSLRLLTILVVSLVTVRASADDANEWIWLFDGKSIEGWTVRGGDATYKVEDGNIVGTTVDGSQNTFLCKGPFDDFVLEFEVLCDKRLNSGVQFRSHVYEQDTPQESMPKRIREKGEVYGYQCEIVNQATGTAGNVWDEGRRTKWLDEFDDPRAKTAYKDGQWNSYRVECKGDHIRTWLNGIPCADFHDDRDATGFIGLQVHSIPKGTGPYSVRWRNLRLKKL